MKKFNEKLEKLKNANCIIYCRVSTISQIKEISLNEQETLCLHNAKRYNMKALNIYEGDESEA